MSSPIRDVILGTIILALAAPGAASAAEPRENAGFVHACGHRPGLDQTARLYGVGNVTRLERLRAALHLELQRVCARSAAGASVQVSPPLAPNGHALLAARP